jgi:hypothetical protein
MSRPGTKLVRNGFEDSVKDYEDLLTEMQAPPAAQEGVFKVIKNFRCRSDYLERIRTGSEAGHRRVNLYFFGTLNRSNLAEIVGIDGPLKAMSREGELKVAQNL